MIIVTGANGEFGRSVVEHLLAAVPAGELAVSVRDPAKAAPLAERGVRVRRGDFDHPETLADAFAGAGTILINGTNYGTAPAVRAAQQASAIRAAKSAGATRLVLTSWADLDTCALPAASDRPGTEKLVTGSSGAWTILRLTYGLPAALARDVRSALSTGVLAAPAAGARVTPATTGELAEATANVLAEPGHDGRTYELNGPDAIGWADLAALASELAGKDIPYRDVPEEEFRAGVVAAGFPPAAVDPLLDLYAAFRAGWTATPSGELSRLLRRPATPSLDAVRQAAGR
ncbi:NAD(P)H-binding protein [Sphaerisporangium corydalis]|uniref:NAD(P)H-binding protein n=1 Tax=Sphaerisporangium corydalis TaxID=1441875 RepID=A0ABV9ECF4_9ACTN|nr:NAD(P)H-binding protein [Sphaerisporangium corydalis]